MSDKNRESVKQTHCRCIACKSEILVDAFMCPICKSYQSRWKNAFLFYASVGGIITVFISLFTYVATNIPEVIKRLYWRDSVEITAFDSRTDIVLHNSGDGMVFVSHLSWQSEKLRSYKASLSINKNIESKSFVFDKLNKSDKEDVKQWVTAPLSEEKWQQALSLGGLDRDCLRWHFFNNDDPFYQTIRSHFKDRFRSVPCDANLVFHSGKDGHKIIRTMTVYGIPFWQQIEACRGKDLQVELPTTGILSAPR